MLASGASGVARFKWIREQCHGDGVASLFLFFIFNFLRKWRGVSLVETILVFFFIIICSKSPATPLKDVG